ncbi:hypothetical protein NHF46_14765 [Arthrobacter alpinus]|nr:hypothetical protein [Arthrobacter alpinus]
MPGKPAFDSTDFRVGDHVHQLLNLAATLVRATTTITAAADARAAETVVLEDRSSGISVSSTAFGDASPLPEEMPFGLDLGSLSQAELGRWSQDLEQLGRFQQAMSVQAAGETAQRVAAGRYSATGAHGAVELLVQSLRISAAEARRRIGLAQNLLPARDLITGELALAAAQPVLGDAFSKGNSRWNRPR